MLGKRKNTYEMFIAEAIQHNMTEMCKLVSLTRIRDYVLTYMEHKNPEIIPKAVKKTCRILVARKLLRTKRDGFTFTTKGKSMMKDELPKREPQRTLPLPKETIKGSMC